MGDRLTLLTGGTGFLGREILRSLLAEPKERVILLLRHTAGRSAGERLTALLERIYEAGDARHAAAKRIGVLEADLSHGEVALGHAWQEQLRGSIVRIIHGAASVTLDHPIAEARAINVGGTQRMLDLAEKVAEIATLERFAYIGTAYIAGDRSGRILEDEANVGQSFHNTYEQSKCEAEELARRYRDRLPISIFRPSIIAGHSTTGVTTTFSKVLYWPARVFASGLVLCIPGDPDAQYDFVPVDFVAGALLHILDREDSLGRCYHLAAGRTITLRRTVELVAELFEMKRIPPFVSPRLFSTVVRPVLYVTLFGKWRDVFLKSDVFVPYLTCRLEFDNTNTMAALARSDLRGLSDTETYLKIILRYVKDRNWGGR